MYIYLDREEAKKGITLVLLTSPKKKRDFKKYFEGKAIEYVGDNLPHFITYVEESDTIREATEEEKLEKGQRSLFDNEALINGKITEYDPETQKVVSGKLIERTSEYHIWNEKAQKWEYSASVEILFLEEKIKSIESKMEYLQTKMAARRELGIWIGDVQRELSEAQREHSEVCCSLAMISK